MLAMPRVFEKVVMVAAVSAMLLLIATSAHADQYASADRTAAAIGHYARARALLVEALAEFEQGRRIARPDMLMDTERWRTSVITRTEELNRVLDPKPRVTRSGVRFKASPALVRREKDRLPSVSDGARLSNEYGEIPPKKIQIRSTYSKPTVAAPASNAAVGEAAPSPAPEEQKTALVHTQAEPTELSKSPVSAEQEAAAPAAQGSELQAESSESELVDEDPAIAQAIQEAINERLQKLSGGLDTN